MRFVGGFCGNLEIWCVRREGLTCVAEVVNKELVGARVLGNHALAVDIEHDLCAPACRDVAHVAFLRFCFVCFCFWVLLDALVETEKKVE